MERGGLPCSAASKASRGGEGGVRVGSSTAMRWLELPNPMCADISLSSLNVRRPCFFSYIPTLNAQNLKYFSRLSFSRLNLNT